MKKILLHIKRLAPWIVAVGIFAYLFNSHPPSEVLKSARLMNAPLFIALAIFYFLLMFLVDTFSISRILGRFGHREAVRELMPARGATYLLMIVNYAASQAAFAYYQYRRHGLPISKMLGIFGIIVVADLYILATLALAASFFTDWPFKVGTMDIAHFIRIFAAIAYALFALLICLKNLKGQFPVLERLRRFRLLDLLATTGFKDYLAVAVARLPVHALIIVGMYAAIHTFNAEVSFVKTLANIPLVFFIGALPITPGGVGTSNAALVKLFEPFVTGPAIASGAVQAGDLIFSFSLAWLLVNYLMKALTGMVCLRIVSRDLFKPTGEVPSARAEEEAAPVSGNI